MKWGKVKKIAIKQFLTTNSEKSNNGRYHKVTIRKKEYE